jgi:hypothetical protein
MNEPKIHITDIRVYNSFLDFESTTTTRNSRTISQTMLREVNI